MSMIHSIDTIISDMQHLLNQFDAQGKLIRFE